MLEFQLWWHEILALKICAAIKGRADYEVATKNAALFSEAFPSELGEEDSHLATFLHEHYYGIVVEIFGVRSPVLEDVLSSYNAYKDELMLEEERNGRHETNWAEVTETERNWFLERCPRVVRLAEKAGIEPLKRVEHLNDFVPVVVGKVLHSKVSGCIITETLGEAKKSPIEVIRVIMQARLTAMWETNKDKPWAQELRGWKGTEITDESWKLALDCWDHPECQEAVISAVEQTFVEKVLRIQYRFCLKNGHGQSHSQRSRIEQVLTDARSRMDSRIGRDTVSQLDKILNESLSATQQDRSQGPGRLPSGTAPAANPELSAASSSQYFEKLLRLNDLVRSRRENEDARFLVPKPGISEVTIYRAPLIDVDSSALGPLVFKKISAKHLKELGLLPFAISRELPAGLNEYRQLTENCRKLLVCAYGKPECAYDDLEQLVLCKDEFIRVDLDHF